MLKNYIKIALRSLIKRRLYTVINLLGLSISISFCLLTFLYVNDEFSYDKFHEKKDRIFALSRIDFKTDDLNTKAGFWDVEAKPGITKELSQNLPFLSLIEERIPEIQSVVRSEFNGTLIRKDGKDIQESIRYVDNDFFEVFSFQFLHGNDQMALPSLNSAVITEEVAEKYFGKTDVIGESLTVASEATYMISGVIKSPKNSSISLNILLPFENSFYYKNNKDNWGYSAAVGFLYLKNASDAVLVKSKINEIYKERFGEAINGQRELLKLSEDNPVVEYDLINIQEMYLDPTVRFGKSSAPLYSYMIIAVALIMLLIAAVNYISISISSASSRAKEIVVRKVVGASTKQVKRQFHTESLLMTGISLVTGYTLMQFLLPIFNELSDKSIELTASLNGAMFIFSAIMLFVLGWIVGGYPSMLLSKYKVAQHLKGGGTHKIKPSVINAMVIFQFSLCILFISVGLTMQRQFNYIGEKDLGFDKEQLVYVSGAWGITEKLKQQLANEPSVEGAFGAGGFLASGQSRSTLVSKNVEYKTARIMVDHDFFETLNIEFTEGQSFDPNLVTEDENKFIINEKFDGIIKNDPSFDFLKKDVLGVVNDFHFESLSEEIMPMQFSLGEPDYLSVLYVKLAPNQIENGLTVIESAWDKLMPNSLVDISFVDTYLDSRYQSKKKWAQIINVSSMTAVVIACIGLFGLTAINAMNRTKEIGIRKVLGASLASLLMLLNRQVIWLVVISLLIALPIAYYIVNGWLDSFAYHIPVGYDLFVLSGLLCLLVVILTVFYHSVRSAKIDPIQLLRDE